MLVKPCHRYCLWEVCLYAWVSFPRSICLHIFHFWIVIISTCILDNMSVPGTKYCSCEVYITPWMLKVFCQVRGRQLYLFWQFSVTNRVRCQWVIPYLVYTHMITCYTNLKLSEPKKVKLFLFSFIYWSLDCQRLLKLTRY